MFGRMWVRPFDLNETLGTDGLIAASSPVQVGWIIEKTDRTLGSIFVHQRFDGPAVHQ